VVYSAYDPELDRKIALKLINSNFLLAERRLAREAQAMAKLSHPNVVPVYDVGTYRKRLFLAMEYIDGVNLRQWLKEAHRPVHEVLDVFLQAGRGLAAAHSA